MHSTTLASGFPEALSNDYLITDTKSCAKQREILEDAEGQARMIQSCIARMLMHPDCKLEQVKIVIRKTRGAVLQLLRSTYEAFYKSLHSSN